MTTDHIYPLFLRCEPRDYIWGGCKLSERYQKGSGRIAESWELCGENVIENGPLAGKRLREVLGEETPLLIKFLDAREKLSVQVHPSDENALTGERGKEELWYVLEAEEDSFLYCGLKRELSREELRAAALDGSIEEFLNKIHVSPGESLYIAPGTIHALGAGMLVAEFQQNSDTTFRLYDYGRGRELHLKRGCAVAERTARRPEKLLPRGSGAMKDIFCTAHLRLRELSVEGGVCLPVADWQHLLLLDGQGFLVHGGEKYELYPGASVYLPAGLGEYEIIGPCRALITDHLRSSV
ncbi:MAG: mannose-6-phosphate isomerase [Ruminococcaceae bacterium]|nr:mannose-6-phosphate isomerase [Oscillospiraceae bacterium]